MLQELNINESSIFTVSVEKTIDHSQAQSQLAAYETEWHTLLAMVEQTKDDNTDNQLDDEVAIDDFLPLIDTLQTQAQHAEIEMSYLVKCTL